MVCLEVWYNALLALLAGYMMNATLAISTFCTFLNITTWELMICIGFLFVASMRVDIELGRGYAKTTRFSNVVNLSTSVSLGLLFSVLFLVFSHVISYAFTSRIEVAKAVSSLASLLSLIVLLNGAPPVLSRVGIGVGRQLWSHMSISGATMLQGFL
ncbi:hypothetical protein NE237_025216 [Protea cynaroides]|uniref:Uncharacterized protein n=1 Tax=Protea cynaroides TaxID=273540 RepID=A0A9Q0H4T9_9MAGN|nr:hypothetical protein NE237_025216 [Protea cynaroides]